MDIKAILKTEKTRAAFLKGLMRLANADGIVDDSEILFYRQAAVALELNQCYVEELENLRGNESKVRLEFDTSEEKMFFLIQAVQLCWVDNNYSDEEKAEIRKICQEINVSDNALEAVEKWAKEGMEWNRRGEELLKLE